MLVISDTRRNKTFKLRCQSEVLISEKNLLVQVVAEVIELIQCKEQYNHAFCTTNNHKNKKKNCKKMGFSPSEQPLVQSFWNLATNQLRKNKETLTGRSLAESRVTMSIAEDK